MKAMDLVAAATAFAVIFPVELPDKTFVATLVLSTRYRPLPVWIGVSSAFLVQTLVAVVAGGLLALLPRGPVLAVTSLLFAVGSVVLLRGADAVDAVDAEEPGKSLQEEMTARPAAATSGVRAATASFVVLFVAEWGDLSQLFTAGLVARTGDPVSVGVGAWFALVTVAGLGVLLGRTLMQFVRLATVRRAGGGVCALLALVTAYEAASAVGLV